MTPVVAAVIGFLICMGGAVLTAIAMANLPWGYRHITCQFGPCLVNALTFGWGAGFGYYLVAGP